MPTVGDDNDFYEDDEPVQKIRARFDAGEKGLTGRRRGWNRTLTFTDPLATGYLAQQTTRAVGERTAS